MSVGSNGLDASGLGAPGQEASTIEATAIDGIEAVALEGISRNRNRWRLIRFCLLAGIAVVVAVILLWWFTKPATLAKWPVAVLLPETKSGPVATNAQRQWEGFKLAFEDHRIEDQFWHKYEFEYPISANEREAISDQLREWYKQGIRTYVITMSGATDLIKGDFAKWVGGLPKNDRPVLVATVASAPGLVDRTNGVFRHYIRSRDESDVLATYLESINAHDIGVFYVDDKYGESAKNILKDRLEEKHIDVHSLLVRLGGNEQADDIPRRAQRFFEQIREANREQSTAAAVIIGYGSMIEKTLAELREFGGEILVVSTFTEEEWRPKLDGEDGPPADRVRFVGPGTRPDNEELRGVVFQFSYLTLDRALRCKDQRGVEAFWDCWAGDVDMEEDFRGKDWADVEFTSDGDSHVSLRLLRVDE